MSAHEIEDLIEHSVRVIDRAGERLPAREARDLIANLYRYQTYFDCGGTLGRVLGILHRRRYLIPLPLRAHPDAARFAALFDRIERSGIWWSLHEARRHNERGLYAYSDRGQSNELVAWNATDVIEVTAKRDFAVDENPGVYYRLARKTKPGRPPELDIEVGSSLWRRLAEGGSLQGLDTAAPASLAPHQAAARIVAEAERQGDRELISWWYAVVPRFAEATAEPVDLQSLRDDPDARSILGAVERARAFEIRADWGCLKVPRPEELGGASESFRAFAPFWYALDWSLPPPRERATVVGEAAKGLRDALEGGKAAGAALTQAVEDMGEFSSDWSSFLSLFKQGFGYRHVGAPGNTEFTDRIKRVVDFSGERPRVDEARAEAELALQAPLGKRPNLRLI